MAQNNSKNETVEEIKEKAEKFTAFAARAAILDNDNIQFYFVIKYFVNEAISMVIRGKQRK